jgi:hypothetical protein
VPLLELEEQLILQRCKKMVLLNLLNVSCD